MTKAKKRKRSTGKAKGSAFEREICKNITTAFGVDVQEAYRSILSGGHKDSFGDISMSKSLGKKFPFAPECKWWKQINLFDLYMPWDKMSKQKNRFGGWWKQTIEGAAKCKRAPLLIFKMNMQTVMCAVVLSDLEKKQQESLRIGPHSLTKGPRKPKGDMHRILVIPWKRLLGSCVKLQKRKKDGNRKNSHA